MSVVRGVWENIPCKDCNGFTELVEYDVKKGLKIYRCRRCGLLHFFKKNMLGWKFVRAAK